MLSHVQLFETPWTVAHQAPLSVGFSYLYMTTRKTIALTRCDVSAF